MARKRRQKKTVSAEERSQSRLNGDGNRGTNPNSGNGLPRRKKAKRNPDKAPSIQLHELLDKAGFNELGARQQSRRADCLQSAAQQLAQDGRQLVGSQADGWACSNLTGAHSEPVVEARIKWVLDKNSETGEKVHLEGDCQCEGKKHKKLEVVVAGRVAMTESLGNLPVLRIPECGSRPAQYIRYAHQCCSSHRVDRVRLLLSEDSGVDFRVLLEMETEPSHPNKLRVSYRLLEKQIIRRLNTIQGQLYVLLKFVFQRLLSVRVLRAQHAKALLFYMLERHRNGGADKGKRQAKAKTETNEQTWKKERLIALLKEALGLMVHFLNNSQAPDACMPNFFMPEVALHLKNARVDFNQAKSTVALELELLQEDVTPLLELVKSHVRPVQSEKIFQPFTVLPLVELQEFEEYTDDALLYLMVQALFNKIPTLQNDEFGGFLKRISELRWLPRTSSVSACLVAMAHLKLGDPESARLKVQPIRWRQVEPFRFCFPCGEEPDFSFLPQFTGSLIRMMNYGSGRILQVNFRCLLWSLQAELLPRQQVFVNEWRRAIEDDPDTGELHTLAHSSRSPERLRKCSRGMEELSRNRRQPDVSDEARAWSVKNKACFNGLILLMILSTVLAGLSRVPFFFADAAVPVGITNILVFFFGTVASFELYRHLRFAFWLLSIVPSGEWRSQWFTTVEFAVILPMLSVALSFLANESFFRTVFIIVSQRLLPDLMLLHSRAEMALVELVLALK